MTLRYLLDTSVISAPIAKHPNARIVQRLEQHGFHCAIAAPVWHELVYGCARLARGKRRAAIDDYLRTVVLASFPILPYDDASAAWHGHERARLEAMGRTPPFVDGQIAAVAHQHRLTLVTANPKHFAPFSGLAVADWSGA